MTLSKGWYAVLYTDFAHPVGPFHSRGEATAAVVNQSNPDQGLAEFALVLVLFDNFAWGE